MLIATAPILPGCVTVSGKFERHNGPQRASQPPRFGHRCDDGSWLTLERLHGIRPRPEDHETPDGWPSLPEILRHAEALP